MDPVELIDAAEQATGASGDTALADAIGLTGRHAPSRIARWRKGTSQPDYEGTLKLLRAAGLLTTKKGPRSQSLAEASTALLGELEGVREAMARIEGLLHEEPPRRRKARA